VEPQCLRPHSAGSTLLRLWPTGSSIGMAPVDYDPVVLLKPFGPHLTAGALPSRENRRCGSRSAYPFPGFRRCALVASPYLSSSALAGEALPPPSDIGPGPRAERDLNPPDASTVRHTLRPRPTPAAAALHRRRRGRYPRYDGSPPLPASPFRRAVPTTPADRTVARVDCFPVHAAFPVLQAGRHPHLYFRGLLRLHARYGPSDRSTAQSGLCHEASIQPVTRPNRSSATRAIDNSLDGSFLHW
jgi:hypothetical protein